MTTSGEEPSDRLDRIEAILLATATQQQTNIFALGEEQQSQLREFRVTTNAALERIDRVSDFLVREHGGETLIYE